jgi:hypothetical protein
MFGIEEKIDGCAVQKLVIDCCRVWNENRGRITVLDRTNRVASDEFGRLVQCEFEGSSISRFEDHIVSIDAEKGAWFLGGHGAWSPIN